MLDPSDFDNDPRDYALQLIEDGRCSFKTLAVLLLKAMRQDAVREALDANELSPRFFDGEQEEEDEQSPDDDDDYVGEPLSAEDIINLLTEPDPYKD